MLTAAFDALYYKLRNTHPRFAEFWQGFRKGVYHRLLVSWRYGGEADYRSLRDFSYAKFLGLLDYVLISSLLLVDLHIPEDEVVPEFYLRLHGGHCTRLLNDYSNKGFIPFLNYGQWKKDGPDLGLSTAMLVLLAREIERSNRRGYFFGTRVPLQNKLHDFENYIANNYATPFTIPGPFYYAVSSTLLSGLELAPVAHRDELRLWLGNNVNDADCLEGKDDSEIFNLLHTELTSDRHKLRCFESVIINRLGDSPLEGTHRWYETHAAEFVQENVGTALEPKLDPIVALAAAIRPLFGARQAYPEFRFSQRGSR